MQQVSEKTSQVNNEYLTPKVPGVCELSSTNPGSVPTNSRPAVTSTNHARYQKDLLTNQSLNGSDTLGQYTPDRGMAVNDRPKLSLDFDVPPNEISESLPLTHNTRSYSETTYKASPSEFSLGKTCSSESGYGTTTRYSMASDPDGMCCKCGHAEGEDGVFLSGGEGGVDIEGYILLFIVNSNTIIYLVL